MTKLARVRAIDDLSNFCRGKTTSKSRELRLEEDNNKGNEVKLFVLDIESSLPISLFYLQCSV